jgi:hypothetical protein
LWLKSLKNRLRKLDNNLRSIGVINH